MDANLGTQSSATLLLSGGIDSTACAAFLLAQNFRLEAVFVDYGQAAGVREELAAAAVAAHFGIPLRHVRCSGVHSKTAGLIRGRNAFLAFAAMMETNTSLIAMGLHAGTPYWDCSPAFVEHVQSMFDAYCDGRVRLFVPFLSWSKREIWDFCLTRGVPLSLTYSCELGLDQPCPRCSSCRDLEALRASKILDNPA